MNKTLLKKNNGQLDELDEFLKIMEEENLHELEVIDGSLEVKLVKRSATVFVPSALHSNVPHRKGGGEGTAKVAEPEVGTPIKSPLAGVFYRSSSPTNPPYVKEGDVVTTEKTLCIIEAMKVLNEINAGVNGRILRILVENGKPVQMGQTLFLVEPSR
ncbi:MAG: hypothetical protein KCHDKBKB_00342 [Elusimicrobia bacterium]|nr:hypothetical protein [Elusimicrobiota bacterium]